MLLVIFTEYYMLSCGTQRAGWAGLVIHVFWAASNSRWPSLLRITYGIWSGWDQRSCQKNDPFRQLGTWVQRPVRINTILITAADLCSKQQSGE